MLYFSEGEESFILGLNEVMEADELEPEIYGLLSKRYKPVQSPCLWQYACKSRRTFTTESEGWPHKRNFCQSPGTGCVPEGDTILAGDMGWGPGAAKWANPRC